MGYTTEFEGQLGFLKPLTAEQELFLREMLPDSYEHTDEHPEWIKPEGYRGYLQLKVTDDRTGIEWDGNEKFYHAVDAVNTVILTMKSKFPDFGLSGQMLAQGEEIGDIWKLKILDGKANREGVDLTGKLCKCPDCGHQWINE